MQPFTFKLFFKKLLESLKGHISRTYDFKNLKKII